MAASGLLYPRLDDSASSSGLNTDADYESAVTAPRSVSAAVAQVATMQSQQRQAYSESEVPSYAAATRPITAPSQQLPPPPPPQPRPPPSSPPRSSDSMQLPPGFEALQDELHGIHDSASTFLGQQELLRPHGHASGQTYYFHPASGETRFTFPDLTGTPRPFSEPCVHPASSPAQRSMRSSSSLSHEENSAAQTNQTQCQFSGYTESFAATGVGSSDVTAAAMGWSSSEGDDGGSGVGGVGGSVQSASSRTANGSARQVRCAAATRKATRMARFTATLTAILSTTLTATLTATLRATLAVTLPATVTAHVETYSRPRS
eukprot:2499828-Pleurochrysis_carterae.AAC.2